MLNKQARTAILSGFLILVVFILAVSPLLFVQAIEIGNYDFEDYKIVEYNQVLIAAEKTHHCEYKPDSINDGYKECSPEVIVWNRRDNPISLDMIKDKFDFDITRAYRNDKLDLYYSTDYEIYNFTKENITKVEYFAPDGTLMTKLNIDYYNVSKIKFSNWKEFDGSQKNLPANTIVGIRFEFELPQYEKASYNFTYKPLNWILDPDVTACGTLNTAGATYTQTANILDDGITTPCIIIINFNITYDGGGYTIRSDDTQPGIYTNSSNTTIKGTDISMATGGNGWGIWLTNAGVSTIYNNTLSDEQGGIILLTGTIGANITNNTISGSSYTGIYVSDTLSDSNRIYNNTLTGNDYGFTIVGDSNLVYDNIIEGITVSVFIIGNNNIIQNNSITYTQLGVRLEDANYNEIIGNTISNASAADTPIEYGISTQSDASYNLFANNTLSDNAEIGISITAGVYNNLTNNTIMYGKRGLTVYSSNYTRITNNKIINQTHTTIYLAFNSHWNTFINITSEIWGGAVSVNAITIDDDATNNMFRDSIFTTNFTNTIMMNRSSTNMAF